MSFTSEVNDFIVDFQDGSEETMRGTTIKLWEAVIKGSPVKEGRFRGNWFASRLESSEVTDRLDPVGATTISNATASVLNQSDWSQFTLTNNLPYSEVIEYGGYPGDGPNTINGFSSSAPEGVVRVNVKRFNVILEAEANGNLP
jgi:hypothetical protein